MELRHLRYFVSVARELNFTRAAQKLHVAQPALSRQIKQLESELGVRLLERDSRGVYLTESGKAFLTEAEELLKRSEQAIRAAKGTKSDIPQLNLGYVWGLFHSLVPRVLMAFRQGYPEIGVNLFDLSALQQAAAIREGKLEAGFIGFAHEAESAGLMKRKVSTVTFLVALPQNHRCARMKQVRLETLAEDLFIGISEQTYPGASQQVSEACRRAGFRPRILQMAERGYTILGLVATGCGVALLPESLKALPHPGIRFRPLSAPPVAELFVAWHPENRTTTLLRFLETLKPN